MFPLTRPFRQGLATLALLVLTVLPTVFVAVSAWRINRPGHIRDVEIMLGRELGLQVTLDAVRYPRPGVVDYRGIVLRQEEPRSKGLTEIARADNVRLVRGEHELTIHAENLTLRGESPRQALAQVGAFFQRSTGLTVGRVSLAAPHCKLDLGRDGLVYTILDVAGEFSADRSNPTLRVAYRVAEGGNGTRCELTLRRDRAADPVRTHLVLKTLDGLPLPARVLNVFFDSAGWLGPAAKVDGVLSLAQTGDRDWEVDFQGNLLDLDLAALVGRRFPRHRLAGPARVSFESARWGERPNQGLGWLEARGELIAHQGVVGMDLLNALAREMKFRLSPRISRLRGRETEIDFQSLGVSFDMRSNGEFHLAGALGNEFAPDTILVNGSTPLAFAPTGAASVHGLIKSLFPMAETHPGVMVPLTPESQLLLCLPVPADITAKSTRTIDGN